MPSPPSRPGAGASVEDRYPPWRQRSHSPESLRDLTDAQEREEELFALTRRLAALESSPLEELYLNVRLLGGASDCEALRPEAAAYAEKMRARAFDDPAQPDMDAEGNPLWISLTLRDRRDGGPVKAGSVLPGEDESAAPRTFLDQSLEKRRENSGLFGAVIALLGRLTGVKKEAPPERRKSRPDERGQSRLDAVDSASSSPLGGFIKMILLGAALALVWHFFGRG